MTGKTHEYTYGAADIVGFDGVWRDELYRPYRVAVNEPWNVAIPERVMCDGNTDDTPRHDSVRSYDASCSCCWLGISHTARLHSKRVIPR